MSSPSTTRAPRRVRKVLLVTMLGLALEFLVLLTAADYVGWGPVIAVVLAAMAVGILVVRTGTPRAWATVRELAGAGPTPDHHLSRSARTDLDRSGAGRISAPRSSELRQVSADLTSDALQVGAGLGMLFPGLISTAVGILLLIPPVRRAVATRLSRRITTSAERRVESFMAGARVVGPTVIVGEATENARFTPGFTPGRATSSPPALEKE